MIIVSTVTYPPSQSTEATRAFIKSTETPLPPFVKRLYVLTMGDIEHGTKVLGIYEVDDGKVPDGIKEVVKRYAELFFGIEGFRYQIEAALTAEEAIPLLQL